MSIVKSLVAILLAISMVPLAVPGADASHCGPVVVFGRVAQVQGQNVGANAGGVGCTALGEASPDVREITPGSPNLQVRFIGSFAGVDTLSGTLSGLGVDTGITLVKAGSVYDSGYVAIDPLATGDVTATVETPDGRSFSIVFHKSA